MDLKALLNKLDTIDQRQVLLESATMIDEVLTADLQLLKESYIALMERVRRKELEAIANIQDAGVRRKQLGQLAIRNDYPGLFDPVNGKWVDAKGDYAWFGPYKAEVEQMEKDGLVPDIAKTSAFFGLMGKDEGEAFKASNVNRTKYDLIDDAEDIITQALKSKAVRYDESAPQGKLAQALTEGFGYTFTPLKESITVDQAKKLYGIIDILAKDAKYADDKEVQELLTKYQEYKKYRTVLVTAIQSAITELKAILNPVATPVNESKQYLKEQVYLIETENDTISAVHIYYDANGNPVEYIITEDVEALGRGVLAGLTFGWGDNAIAKMISTYKGTKYGDELLKQLQASEAAKKRSPVWYYGGQAAGSIAIIPGGGGLVAGALKVGGAMAVQAGSDAYIRTPHNAKYVGDAMSKQKPADADAVKKVQKAAGAEPTGVLTPGDANAVAQQGTAITKTSATMSSKTDPAEVAEGGAEQQAAMKEFFAKVGVKNLEELKTKMPRDLNQAGEYVAKILGITSQAPVANESIIYSSMTDTERMSYLRDKLSQLDEAGLPLGALGRFGARFGIATAEGKALFALEKIIGKQADEVVIAAASTRLGPRFVDPGNWKMIPGTEGKVWKNTTTGQQTDVVTLTKQAEKDWKLLGKPAPPAPAPAPAPAPGPGAVTFNAGKQVASAEIQGVKYVKDKAGNWFRAEANGTFTQVTKNKLLTKLAAAEVKTPLMARMAGKFPKTVVALGAIGAVAKFGWNYKWWLVMAGLVAGAYFVNQDTTNGPEGNGNSDGQRVEKPEETEARLKREAEAKEKEAAEKKATTEKTSKIQANGAKLQKLITELVNMYPVDDITNELKTQVDELFKQANYTPTGMGSGDAAKAADTTKRKPTGDGWLNAKY